MKKLFLAAVCLTVFSTPFLVSAYPGPWDPAALRGPLVACTSGRCSWQEFFDTVGRVITFALALLFYGIAPILFVWGGIRILTSGSSPEGMSEGKKIITGTLMAILIALLSYWVVKFVVGLLGVAGRVRV